jgi:hypothetical protein
VSADDALARDVFFLAYHLHWGHAEILGLPVPDRRRYVALLEEQLKRERDAMREGGRP